MNNCNSRVDPDPREPIVLDYARLRAKPNLLWIGLWRASRNLVIVASVLVLIHKGFQKHYTKEYCKHCLTHGSARYATFLGVPVEYRRTQVRGQVFMLCSDRDPTQCQHKWVVVHDEKHTFLGVRSHDRWDSRAAEWLDDEEHNRRGLSIMLADGVTHDPEFPKLVRIALTTQNTQLIDRCVNIIFTDPTLFGIPKTPAATSPASQAG